MAVCDIKVELEGQLKDLLQQYTGFPSHPRTLRHRMSTIPLGDEGHNVPTELAFAGKSQVIATNNVKDLAAPEPKFDSMRFLEPQHILRLEERGALTA